MILGNIHLMFTAPEPHDPMEGLDAQLPVDPVPGQGGTAVVLAGVARGRDAGPLPLDEERIAVGQRLARLLHRGEDLSGERLPPALGAPVPQPQHRPEAGGLARLEEPRGVMSHDRVHPDRLGLLRDLRRQPGVGMRRPGRHPQRAEAAPEQEEGDDSRPGMPPSPQRHAGAHDAHDNETPWRNPRGHSDEDPREERERHRHERRLHPAVIGVISFSNRCNHTQKNAGESVSLLRVRLWWSDHVGRR